MIESENASEKSRPDRQPCIAMPGPLRSKTEPAGMRPRPRSVNPEHAALGGAAPGRPPQRGQNVRPQSRGVNGRTAVAANGELPMSCRRPGSVIRLQALCHEGRPCLGRLPTTTWTIETGMDDEIQAVRGVLLGVLSGALFWIAMYVAIVIL